MARTQRVENLLKGFMQLHKDGYSIREIADHYQVDFSTVYNHLQEIADANGVTRESLLSQKSSPHLNLHHPFRKEKIDAENLKREFKKVDEHLDNLITEIDTILLNTKE